MRSSSSASYSSSSKSYSSGGSSLGGAGFGAVSIAEDPFFRGGLIDSGSRTVVHQTIGAPVVGYSSERVVSTGGMGFHGNGIQSSRTVVTSTNVPTVGLIGGSTLVHHDPLLTGAIGHSSSRMVSSSGLLDGGASFGFNTGGAASGSFSQSSKSYSSSSRSFH